MTTELRGCTGAEQDLNKVILEFNCNFGTRIDLFLDIAETGDNVFYTALSVENARLIAANLTEMIARAEQVEADMKARRERALRTRRG